MRIAGVCVQVRACVSLGVGVGVRMFVRVFGALTAAPKCHDALVRRDTPRPREPYYHQSLAKAAPWLGLMAGRTLRKRLVSLGRRDRTQDASPEMRACVGVRVRVLARVCM